MKQHTEKKLAWLIKQTVHVQFEFFQVYTELAKLLVNQRFSDKVEQKAGSK